MSDFATFYRANTRGTLQRLFSVEALRTDAVLRRPFHLSLRLSFYYYLYERVVNRSVLESFAPAFWDIWRDYSLEGAVQRWRPVSMIRRFAVGVAQTRSTLRY